MPKRNQITMTIKEQIKAAIFFKVLVMAKAQVDRTRQKPKIHLKELQEVFAKLDHKLTI